MFESVLLGGIDFLAEQFTMGEELIPNLTGEEKDEGRRNRSNWISGLTPNRASSPSI